MSENFTEELAQLLTDQMRLNAQLVSVIAVLTDTLINAEVVNKDILLEQLAGLSRHYEKETDAIGYSPIKLLMDILNYSPELPPEGKHDISWLKGVIKGGKE